MVNYEYYVWVEIEANKKRILDPEYFERMLVSCRESGIGSIIISVKDTTGFGIYKSSIVPHYSRFDSDFEDVDYFEKYIEMAHSLGMKVYAGIDVFAEGRVNSVNKLSPGFVHEDWQTHLHGIDSQGRPAIRPITDLKGIKTIGSIDDFSEVFVNPVMDEVRKYEISIIKELCDNYKIDGVVLDRARFVGLGSDFSSHTRRKFEDFVGKTVENWPEDIYRIKENKDGTEVEYGTLFGKWITFRAGVIRDFIKEAGEMISSTGKDIDFIDYTGSWYPIYYLVGANWASNKYTPEEYPWVGSEYSDTGYAHMLDKLMSGFYYPDVTIAEAEANNRPAYWYSVEGSGDMVEKVVKGDVPYIGSLYLKQYEDKPQDYTRAVKMCFEKSRGCMLFDLCYLDDYNWWEASKIERETK